MHRKNISQFNTLDNLVYIQIFATQESLKSIKNNTVHNIQKNNK
jgi:hypothetical protein